MASLTRVTLGGGQVASLIRGMLGSSTRIARVRRLRGGKVNTCLAIGLGGGREVVLKVAPPSAYVGLTCERDIIRTEIDFYRRAGQVGVPVPQVLATDFGRRTIDTDCFLMSLIPGRPLSQVRPWLPAWLLRGLRRDLGRTAAAIAAVEGPTFGYPSVAGLQASTYREAFARMIAAVLDDAARYAVELPVGRAALEALVARAAPVLDEVQTPRLVHFDLWDGNVMVALSRGVPRLSGFIDGDRAFFGDPYAELAPLTLFEDVDRHPVLLAAWAERAGRPLVLDGAARVRVLLAHLYLYLTLYIDPVPRGLDPVTRFVVNLRVGRWLRRTCDQLSRSVGRAAP